MTAADAREDLEAITWRALQIDGHGHDTAAVIAILAAADAYADAYADAVAEQRISDRRHALDRRAAADDEVAAHSGRTGCRR